MMRKTRSDFDNHDDWLAHILSQRPVPKRAYALASGRMELFRSFYRMQGLPFPAQFVKDLERIQMLHTPERTAELESLNDVVLRSLTKHLFNRGRPTISERDARPPTCPREQIGQLLNHLAQKNPYFALWVAYKRSVSDHSIAEDWDVYLLQKRGTESTEDIAFALAMAELDRILSIFRDRNWALSSLSFERIWFLHYLRGPERMAQTRAALGMLTAELTACTSA
jgi:hypothetical protein